MRATAIALLLWSALPATALAAGIKVTIDRDVATLEDQLLLTVTVEGSQLSRPTLPELNAFDVQSAGSSRQMRIVNGLTDW